MALVTGFMLCSVELDLEVTGSPQIPVTQERSQNKTVNLGQAQAPPVSLPKAQCIGDSGGASLES